MMKINVDFLRIYPASGYRTQFHKRWQSQIDASRSIADAVRTRPAGPSTVAIKICNVVNIDKRHLITIHHDAGLKDAAALLAKSGVRSLIVTETARRKTEIVGMLTQTDLVRAIHEEKPDTAVHQIMTKAGDLFTTSLDDDVGHALFEALARGHSLIPIRDKTGTIVSMCSLKELARAWCYRSGG